MIDLLLAILAAIASIAAVIAGFKAHHSEKQATLAEEAARSAITRLQVEEALRVNRDRANIRKNTRTTRTEETLAAAIRDQLADP